MKKVLTMLLSAMVAATMLAACGNSSGDAPAGETDKLAGSGDAPAAGGEGQVYFQNFKPEQGDAYKKIAEQYTSKTGVPVKVETAAAGTYEQTLRSEMAKKEAPTIFQVNGPVGYTGWKDYCADLSGTDIYNSLTDKSLAIGEGGGIYAIPFAIEGYGIIVNKKIMGEYFALDGAKAKSLEEINGFDKLKEVVEDMQAKKAELGIEGVFASTSLKPGEDWRWQTHLMNLPMYYEWEDGNVDLSQSESTKDITFKYDESFKAMFDLYLQNSTVQPAITGSKTVSDSMAEFALGTCAMVQNGNWAYGQISEVEGSTVAAEDVAFLPVYIGAEGEAGQGICIGTENFFCINKNAPEADQKASLDFLTWLYTSEEGKPLVTNELGFIAPFSTFTDADKPADPLGQQVTEWNARTDVKNIPWNFTVFPSQQFKDNFGGYLLQYAQGQMEWGDVKETVIADWAAEKSASSD